MYSTAQLGEHTKSVISKSLKVLAVLLVGWRVVRRGLRFSVAVEAYHRAWSEMSSTFLKRRALRDCAVQMTPESRAAWINYDIFIKTQRELPFDSIFCEFKSCGQSYNGIFPHWLLNINKSGDYICMHLVSYTIFEYFTI